MTWAFMNLTYTSAFVVRPFRNAMEHWNADGRINT